MEKFLNNRHSTQADYQLRCLQHLEHDFNVLQSLRETTSINNYQSYVNLLNQISFHNKNKKRQINHLMHQSRCYTAQSEQPKMIRTLWFRQSSRWRDLIDFEKKIMKQEQVKDHLLAQLNQVSKSINLLKGDVRKIIEKNQSTIVLQKKTSKVKLIAHNQLKKVNLALFKDHSQIMERNNMQIKFNKKMKNICNSENNVLKRIQSEFLKMEKRKKSIYDKISRMEDIMKNLNKREKIKQEIKIVNQRNKIHLQQLFNLLELIKKIEVESQDKKSILQQKDQNLLDTHLSLKTQRFKLKIKETQRQIVNFISQLNHSIQKSEKYFKSNSQKVYQYKTKLQEFDYQVRAYQIMTYGKGLFIADQQKREYGHKLMQLKKSLSSLLIIWQFIQNHPKFTKLIDEYQNNDTKKSRRESVPSRFYRKSEEFQKNMSIVNQENNYSNKFCKLILYLADNGQQINLQSQFLIKSLEMTIVMWLKGLKNLIMEQKKLGKLQSLKKTKSLETFKFKSTIQLIEQMGEPQQKKYRLSVEQQEQDKLKTILQLIAPKKAIIMSIKNEQIIPKTHKQAKTEGNQQYTAKRNKVLKKVEYDYYKMLKNVLKIQKQTTKNNYNFNKNFSRAKFTQKDIIQQEKRYQSNFALQFIKKEEQSMIIQSKRSIASKASRHDQQFKKRNNLHPKTDVFNTFKPDDEGSSRVTNKNNIRESIFNAKKFQSKSKLIERQSIDSQNNKQSRTSVFFSKRAMINFADQPLHLQY